VALATAPFGVPSISSDWGMKAAGGAGVILGAGNSNEALADAFKGLVPNGRMIVMGVAYDQFRTPNMGSGGGELIMNSQQIMDSAHNGNEYLVEVSIAATGKVKAMVEVYPKERVAEAYDRVATGKARFCAVVTY
jgi:D-arabinose 1-dehydrogenase-like Zn-dependent alcohol dehydrogenase